MEPKRRQSQKLTYRFFDPNPIEVTAEHVSRVLVEVAAKKIECMMREQAQKQAEERQQAQGEPTY